MKATKHCLLAAVLMLGLGIKPVLAAGKPSPPPAPGPVAISTCQTISQSGSYVLSGNITQTAVAPCIVLQANDVTIDLAGFTITGSGAVAGPPGADAIGITDGGDGGPVLHGIEIRNGVIQQFNLGVDVNNSTNVIVEGLRLHDDVSGVFVGQGLVRDNVVEVTVGFGILLEQPGGIASGNTVVATQPAQQGIAEPCPNLLIGNIVTGPFLAGTSNLPGCVAVNNLFLSAP